MKNRITFCYNGDIKNYRNLIIEVRNSKHKVGCRIRLKTLYKIEHILFSLKWFWRCFSDDWTRHVGSRWNIHRSKIFSHSSHFSFTTSRGPFQFGRHNFSHLKIKDYSSFRKIKRCIYVLNKFLCSHAVHERHRNATSQDISASGCHFMSDEEDTEFRTRREQLVIIEIIRFVPNCIENFGLHEGLIQLQWGQAIRLFTQLADIPCKEPIITNQMRSLNGIINLIDEKVVYLFTSQIEVFL